MKIIFLILIIHAHLCYMSALSIKQNDFDGTLNEQVLADWGYFTNSTLLNLRQKSIKIVADSTFDNFKSLTHIDLAINELKQISPKTFTSVATLEALNLKFPQYYLLLK